MAGGHPFYIKSMKRENHRKNFIKLITDISYRYTTREIFYRFVEMAAIAVSNSVDKSQYDRREQRYLQLASEFNNKEMSIMPQLMGELIEALEEEPGDVLGSIYCEMEMANKHIGQVFTPIQLSRLMGDMTLSGCKEALDKKGYVTVSDPACGGGSTLIGMALAMRDAGYNYQKQMCVQAIDIDIRAVHMCYLQLSLLGIPAEIIHGDSLAVKFYDHWYTPFYILDGWKSVMDKQPVIKPKLEVIKPGTRHEVLKKNEKKLEPTG